MANPSSLFSLNDSYPSNLTFFTLYGFLELAFTLRLLPGFGMAMGSSTTLFIFSGLWSISVNWLYISYNY